MFDRRLARGSAFTGKPIYNDCLQFEAAKYSSQTQQRQLLRLRSRLQETKSILLRVGTPPPVSGRKHEPVQTELHLYELLHKPTEFEVASQTDYYLEKPATVPTCTQKVGRDAFTQIYPGELFDFDVEIQPIIEVLVGKTIEQSLGEVLEEDEIALIKEQKRKFLEIRASEKAEQQRLEEEELRLREEKCRRAKQIEEALQTHRETEERVAASVLLTDYIAELIPDVLNSLKVSGYLQEEIQSDVENEFTPWLIKEVNKEMDSTIQNREIITELVMDIIKNRATIYRHFGEENPSKMPKMEISEDVCDTD